ncbi:MAG: acetamidase/formamidase family protein [Chloroflexota bacterium]|nr:acetamidase/formamidase family protein [Chloroflexota bacterium]
MEHRFEPTRFYNAFGPYEPVLEVDDGDTIITTTLDARGKNKEGRKVAERGNPLTGPFYVRGAEAGDTLRVHIDKVLPNRAQGWSRTVIADHVVDAPFVREMPEDVLAHWEMNIERGTATLVDPETDLGRLTLSLAPMLGCLGVAPKRHQAISSATSAEHGGNMDYRALVAGTTVYFPVFEEGALLFTGDGHAIQGDGEIVGTGIEISMDVQLTVHVLKDMKAQWPRGENEDYIFAAGNARPLDQALQHATTEMLRWLESDYSLDHRAASTLLGQCVEYDVGNVFDPAYTVVCKIAKHLLPARN